MEQRGSGFARMREAMLNHGLEALRTLGQQDGFFVVTLPGPAGNREVNSAAPDHASGGAAQRTAEEDPHRGPESGTVTSGYAGRNSVSRFNRPKGFVD